MTQEEVRRYLKIRNKSVSAREYPLQLTGFDIDGDSVRLYNGRNQLIETVSATDIRKALGYK